MKADNATKKTDPQRLAEAVLAARSRRLRARRPRRTRVELESGHHAAELGSTPR